MEVFCGVCKQNAFKLVLSHIYSNYGLRLFREEETGIVFPVTTNNDHHPRSSEYVGNYPFVLGGDGQPINETYWCVICNTSYGFNQGKFAGSWKAQTKDGKVNYGNRVSVEKWKGGMMVIPKIITLKQQGKDRRVDKKEAKEYDEDVLFLEKLKKEYVK